MKGSQGASPPGGFDAHEVQKFSDEAMQWWDPEGPAKPLHQLNPLRLQYISAQLNLKNKAVLDLGCGGGLLSEALCKAGAKVTAIDANTSAIDAAILHARAQNLLIDYQSQTLETFIQTSPTHRFDLITCMELLEHVPDPAALIKQCTPLLHPHGLLVLSTLNRTLKSYCVAILGAEYLLKRLPRGTHDYENFIRPSELAKALRAAGLHLNDLRGISYNMLQDCFCLSADVSVNYLATGCVGKGQLSFNDGEKTSA